MHRLSGARNPSMTTELQTSHYVVLVGCKLSKYLDLPDTTPAFQPSRVTRTTNLNIFFISVPATQIGQAAASGEESRNEEMAFIRPAEYPRHVLSSPLEGKSFKHFNQNK